VQCCCSVADCGFVLVFVMPIAAFIASPISGVLSDLSARKYPQTPAARVIPGVCLAAAFTTVGAIIYGWTLTYKTHIVGPLAGQAALGFGCSATLPAIFG
jgi:MFS family permease